MTCMIESLHRHSPSALPSVHKTNSFGCSYPPAAALIKEAVLHVQAEKLHLPVFYNSKAAATHSSL